MSIFAPRNQQARPLGAYRDGTLGMTTFGSEVVDPDVKRYQAMMNTSLVKLGFSPIAVDGKLGKGTCGASHLFDSAPEGFDTAAPNWDDNLAMQVHTACDGQPYAVPLLANKTSAYVQGNTDPACQGSAQKLPTGASPQTLAFQTLANTQLVGNGYNPIATDSKFGPATCGAMKLLDQIAGTGYVCQYGGNCTSYTMPTKKASVVVGTPPLVSPRPAPVVLPQKKPISTASLAMGGLALLAAGGAYYYAKKKGMV